MGAIYAQDGGSGDGSQGSPFDLDGAVDYVNGTWAQDEELTVVLMGDFTLAASPSSLTKSGLARAQVVWQGRNSAGDTRQQIVIDAADTATQVFHWNTGNAQFRYHNWQNITVKNISGTNAAWHFNQPGVSRCSWFMCLGDSNQRGWTFTQDVFPYLDFVGCGSISSTGTGFKVSA